MSHVPTFLVSSEWGDLCAGKDKSVILWSIHDHISSLASDPGSARSPGSGGANAKHPSKTGGSNDKPTDSPSVEPRGIYQGHGDTVEDVQFCPTRYVLINHQMHFMILNLFCWHCHTLFPSMHWHL